MPARRPDPRVKKARGKGVDVKSVRYEELGAAMGAVQAQSRKTDGRPHILVDLVNRGVAVSGNKVLVSTENGPVSAIIEAVGSNDIVVRPLVGGKSSKRTHRVPPIFVIGLAPD